MYAAYVHLERELPWTERSNLRTRDGVLDIVILSSALSPNHVPTYSTLIVCRDMLVAETLYDEMADGYVDRWGSGSGD